MQSEISQRTIRTTATVTRDDDGYYVTTTLQGEVIGMIGPIPDSHTAAGVAEEHIAIAKQVIDDAKAKIVVNSQTLK